MTATTNDISTEYRDGELISVPVAADAKIRVGTIVCTNATGFAVEGETDTDLVYVGRADGDFTIDNTGGADGDLSVLVRRKKQFLWLNSEADPVTQAEFGVDCYIVDNQTVAKTDGTGTRSKAGRVFGIDSNGIWVE